MDFFPVSQESFNNHQVSVLNKILQVFQQLLKKNHKVSSSLLCRMLFDNQAKNDKSWAEMVLLFLFIYPVANNIVKCHILNTKECLFVTHCSPQEIVELYSLVRTKIL